MSLATVSANTSNRDLGLASLVPTLDTPVFHFCPRLRIPHLELECEAYPDPMDFEVSIVDLKINGQPGFAPEHSIMVRGEHDSNSLVILGPDGRTGLFIDFDDMPLGSMFDKDRFFSCKLDYRISYRGSAGDLKFFNLTHNQIFRLPAGGSIAAGYYSSIESNPGIVSLHQIFELDDQLLQQDLFAVPPTVQVRQTDARFVLKPLSELDLDMSAIDESDCLFEASLRNAMNGNNSNGKKYLKEFPLEVDFVIDVLDNGKPTRYLSFHSPRLEMPF